MLPSPRYGNGTNGKNNGQNGNNPRPRSLIMQKVDNDSSSRRNSEVPPLSRQNSTMRQYENRVEQEKNQAIDKIDKTAQDGNDKMAQAKANLADDLAYVKAGARRASKYDLYFVQSNNKLSSLSSSLQQYVTIQWKNKCFFQCEIKIKLN